jgi:hypothetical protein
MDDHDQPLPKTPSRAVNRGVKGGRRDEDRVTVRFRGEERAKVALAAARAGVGVASYVRARALTAPVPRGRKLSPIDAVLMAKGVSALNKVGSNLNQIAKAANSGASLPQTELNVTLAEIRATLDEIQAATGRKKRP